MADQRHGDANRHPEGITELRSSGPWHVPDDALNELAWKGDDKTRLLTHSKGILDSLSLSHGSAAHRLAIT